MKLALWNVQTGAGDRCGTLAAGLRADAPDAVVLNEYHPGRTEPLIDELRQHGWRHVALSTPPPHCGGVAVCSRLPMRVRETPVDLAAMGHRCIIAEIQGGADVVLWAVYAPYAGDDVAPFWRTLHDGLSVDLGADTLLVGDLNAGMPGADIPNNAELAGTPFFRRLAEIGYTDLWRQAHGERAREYTWHGEKYPYRIDHAFGSPGAAARMRSCEYRHEDTRPRASDHSRLVLQLTPKPLARKGSRRWIQLAVNRRPEVLNTAILRALAAPTGATVEWLSPLENEGYIESRDGDVWTRLQTEVSAEDARAFWPARGPVWDGLAVTSDGKRLLVEAKANIPEMLGGGTRATGVAREQILTALRGLQRKLKPRGGADWAGRFYQHANRLAHLDFLRGRGVDAHLVYVYFLNARDVDGPTARAECQGAVRLMESYLGLGPRHALAPFVHEVFVDVDELRAGEGENVLDSREAGSRSPARPVAGIISSEQRS
jgi:exonuclease III